MPILIGLLVVAFAIAADLAHEAWTTALSQQEISERAVRDFVRFAATSAGYEARAAIDLGLRALFTTITGGIFEPGFPDCFQQMWAAYAAERAGALGNKFGCVTPEEAVLSHKVFAAALQSQRSKTAVAI